MTEARTRCRILEEYSRGAIAARQAAARLGGDTSVHDVPMLRRAARPPLPRPSPERLEHEKCVGLALYKRAARRRQP